MSATMKYQCELGTSVTFPVIGNITSAEVLDSQGAAPSGNYILTTTSAPVSYVTISPQTTGLQWVHIVTDMETYIVTIECVRYSDSTLLNNLMDYSAGNWSWDKNTNVMTLYTRTGTVLQTFNMVATPVLTSRTSV